MKATLRHGQGRLGMTIKQGAAALLAGAIAATALAGVAEARKARQQPADAAIPNVDNGQPLFMVVSLGAQKLDIYRGTTLVTTSPVSSGMPGRETAQGVFSILEKQRWHHSNIYSGAPMPFMNRITWSGTALHAGVLPGYAASHGCIRLPYSFAPKFYAITTPGDNVVVTSGRPAPALISNPNLFQPLRVPPPPIVSINEPRPADANDRAAALEEGTTSPLILAKAEIPDDESDDAAASSSDGQHAVEASDDSAKAPHAISVDSDEGETADPADKGIAAAAVAAANPAVPAVPAPPNASARKIDAALKVAAVAAAEPRFNAPLRILITKATQQDKIIGVQNLLASLGYLPQQNFDGTLGKATVGAIKAFQKANGMAPSGTFDAALTDKVYAVAGKTEPPSGHIFVRQQFARVFDAPMVLKDPDAPLGIHAYVAMKFSPHDTKAQWMGISVEGGDASAPLDRIVVPDDIRQKISERLTPGSTLILADSSVNSAALPKGGDFMVIVKGSAGKLPDRPQRARSYYRQEEEPRSYPRFFDW